MTSQITLNDHEMERDGSNISEIAKVNTRDSQNDLREEHKPEECVLKVTRKVGQRSKNKSALESECSNLDTTTSKQTLPLDRLESPRKRSKKHGLQTNSSDLRRYSRACKEKKDGVSQNQLRQTKRQQTNTTKSKEFESLPSPHSSGHHQPVHPLQEMGRKRQALSKVRERSAEVSSNVRDSMDVKPQKHILLKSDESLRKGRLSKTRNSSHQGVKRDVVIDQSKLQNKLISKPARMEKIKAQQKLTSHLNTKKTGVRARGSPQTDLIINSTSPGNAGTRKNVKPRQTTIVLDVKPKTDESNSTACQSKMDKQNVSHNIQCDNKFKKPRKIDKRRKRFRRMKAAELLNLEKACTSLESQKDVNSAALNPVSCDQSVDKSLSSVKKGQLMAELKTNALTKLASQPSGPKRKQRRKRSWWKDKRRGQTLATGRQDVKKKLSTVERTQSTQSISSNSQPHVDSNKTDLALSFGDALQDCAKPQAASSAKQVVDSKDDENDSTVKSQLENEKNVDVEKSGVIGQSDGEMDGSNMEVSQAFSLTNEDLSGPPEMDMTDIALATPVLVDFNVLDKSTEQSNPKSDEILTNKRLAASRSDTVPYVQSDDRPARGGRRRKTGGPLKCEFCCRLFIHMSAYVIHRRIHTGEKPHACNICGKAFAQRSNLNAHMRIHDGIRRKQCCGIQFSSQAMFRAHRKTHKEMSKTEEGLGGHSNSPGTQEAEKTCPCPICGKSFRYHSMLKTHMRVHSGEKPFSCKVCGKSFSQATTVRVHERIHWSVKPYVCPDCGRGFSQIGTLKVHACKVRNNNPINVSVAYRCHLCHKCFSDKQQYECHLQSHTNTQQYACESCDERFNLLSELHTHSFYCSKVKTTDPAPPPPSCLSHTSSLLSNSHPQRPPPSQSPSKSLPKLHLLANTKTTSVRLKHKHQPSTTQEQNTNCNRKLSMLTCPINLITNSVDDYSHPESTSATSTIIFQLNKLDQKPDPRKYFCPCCGRLFRHVMRLRAHMLTHSRSKSYTCGCGKTLENWRRFWQHQRVHRQRKGRFFCPRCTRGFRFVSSYQDHLLEHPELNAYTCPLCPLTFPNSESLRAHQHDWHKGTLPFICSVCGKGFSSQRMLDRHSLSHRTNRQTCFKQQEVEKEPVVMPYQCAKCDLTFKTVDLLFQHQLCHSLSEENPSGSIGEAGGQNPLNRDQYTNTSSPCLTTYIKSPTVPTMNISANPQEVSLPLDPVPSQNSQSPNPRPGQEMSTSLQKPSLDSSPYYSSSLQPPDGQLAKQTVFTFGKASKSAQHVVGSIPPQDHVVVVDKGSHSSCAECGAVFTGVSELFEHYLLHARGEV